MSDASKRDGAQHDPEHWRRQALEMRRLAEQSRDDVRAGLLKIAAEYDLIAEKVASGQRGGARPVQGSGGGGAKGGEAR
jgi:hypothetical protein